MILQALQEAKQRGLSMAKGCEVLGLSKRSVERWLRPREPGTGETRTSRPYNALTPSESELVREMLRSAEFADFSVRELSLTALERYGSYISPVTFWQYQKQAGCNGPRRGKRQRKGSGNKPDTDWVDGPNQLWSWDITYLATGRPYEFWYMYALQDWYSRKVVAWLIADSLHSREARSLWDLGLLNEGLLLHPNCAWPISLSDRGSQMRAISTKRYFKKIGVSQLFARPRTPNDNPKIEALFSVVKTEPEYPGRFSRIEEARAYFSRFFKWYNEGHAHTSLKMLTPHQVHTGAGEAVLKARSAVREATLRSRREYFETGEEVEFKAERTLFTRETSMRFQGMEEDREEKSSCQPESAKKTRQLLLN